MQTKGLTLVELMVTLAVAIVLLAVGIPMFDTMRDNNRATAETNKLVMAINLARSEAVRTGAPVTLCAKDDADPADLDCGGAGDWDNGWMVYRGAPGDTVTLNGNLVRVWEQAADRTEINTAAAAIQFDARGGLVGAAVSVQLWIEGCTGNKRRQMDLSAVGRLNTSLVACP